MPRPRAAPSGLQIHHHPPPFRLPCGGCSALQGGIDGLFGVSGTVRYPARPEVTRDLGPGRCQGRGARSLVAPTRAEVMGSPWLVKKPRPAVPRGPSAPGHPPKSPCPESRAARAAAAAAATARLPALAPPTHAYPPPQCIVGRRLISRSTLTGQEAPRRQSATGRL